MANSVDEWLEMARQQQAAARHMLSGPPEARATVVFHVGSSIEFALKALIMKVEGLNRWPEKSDPGNYWTHDLTELRKKLKLKIEYTDPVAPFWQVVKQWNRSADYSYNPKPMPMTVAESYIEAAYGPNGVMEWVLSKLT